MSCGSGDGAVVVVMVRHAGKCGKVVFRWCKGVRDSIYLVIILLGGGRLSQAFGFD